jgi:fumarate reductase flavoprotein subunit
MKKQVSYRGGLAAALIALGLFAGACASSDAGKGVYAAGTYEAEAKGFGGEVRVAVTVDSKRILKVEASGPKETAGVGSRAIDALPKKIVDAQSADVDGVSGATYSSAAVKAAAVKALDKAKGGSVAALSMKDGEYTAKARGFNLLKPVEVKVQIAGNKIVSARIADNGETGGMLQAVTERLIPRVIEGQSLEVDAVTGATATSNAVKRAIQDCCAQAGAVGSALLAKKPAPAPKAREYTVDVAVVGMGGSGTAAALSAAEKGLKVLALDKAGKWAGTSAVTSGPMAINAKSQVEAQIDKWPDPIANKPRTKAAGEKLVDGDALYADWLEYTKVDGKQDAKPEIIKEILDLSGPTIDWLSGYGFGFQAARGFVGGKWAIYSPYVGDKAKTEDFFAAAYAKFTKELGGQYLLETEATDLIVEGGKVVGVKAKARDGAAVTVRAKAVILATGGFGGNPEMQKKYMGEAWKLYGSAQNDGAGINMAVAQGAATYNIDMPPMSHFVAPSMIMTSFQNPSDNDIPYALVCTAEAMAVDQRGKRFGNESDIAMSAYKAGAAYFAIYSKEQIETLKAKGFAFPASGRYLSQGGVKANVPLANIDAVLDEGIKMGFIYKAKSVQDLAKAIGGAMSAQALQASIEGYQASAAGNDPLGKAADKFARLGPVAAGSEYYVAVTGAPYIYSTCGGLDVDKDMRVLKKGGAAIPGLYAVGTDSMGVLFTNKKGYANYGGVAQGYAFTSGKIAGESAAADLAKK